MAAERRASDKANDDDTDSIANEARSKEEQKVERRDGESTTTTTTPAADVGSRDGAALAGSSSDASGSLAAAADAKVNVTTKPDEQMSAAAALPIGLQQRHAAARGPTTAGGSSSSSSGERTRKSAGVAGAAPGAADAARSQASGAEGARRRRPTGGPQRTSVDSAAARRKSSLGAADAVSATLLPASGRRQQRHGYQSAAATATSAAANVGLQQQQRPQRSSSSSASIIRSGKLGSSKNSLLDNSSNNSNYHRQQHSKLLQSDKPKREELKQAQQTRITPNQASKNSTTNNTTNNASRARPSANATTSKQSAEVHHQLHLAKRALANTISKSTITCTSSSSAIGKQHKSRQIEQIIESANKTNHKSHHLSTETHQLSLPSRKLSSSSLTSLALSKSITTQTSSSQNSQISNTKQRLYNNNINNTIGTALKSTLTTSAALLSKPHSNSSSSIDITSPVSSSRIKTTTSNNMADQAVIDKLEAGFAKLQAATPEQCHSLLKKYLTREVLDKLKTKKTGMGATLLDVVQSGVENLDSGVGIYAPDAESYTLFGDLFNPIIEDYHGGFKATDKHPASDFGDINTLVNVDPNNEFVISTRVRCGRSLQGYPFNPCLTEAQYKEMEQKVSTTLKEVEGDLAGTYYPLTGMTKETQQQLIDDHFLFKEGDRFLQAANACRYWPTGRGIYHNASKTFLVWVNEEDHLRIISMQKGGDLKTIYDRLVRGAKAIEAKVPFSRDDRLGFLTFCPTNLGTTIRASVHIKLPKLAADRKKLEEVAGRYNLQVRGTSGEHTESVGGVYDISNKRRLGLTEYQAVREMQDGILELIKIEKSL